MSVHKGGACSGGVWSGGCLVRGVPILGDAWSRGVPGWGVPGLGECLVWGVPGPGGWSGPRGCLVEIPSPRPRTATAVGVTHPTGMHSCY